jgi:glycosyltransferase involved in cell wall biosynthesis
MNLKICIISEALERPFDEGLKIFVYNLVKELSKTDAVLGLGRTNKFVKEIEAFCTKALPANKLFMSIDLWKKIGEFRPDIIYYIPTACATFFGFLRTRVLKLYGKGAKTVMVTLQPREYSFLIKKIIPLMTPDLVLAQTGKTQESLRHLGCKVKKITAGVDLRKFSPVTEKARRKLKKKYGFPNDKFLVLHVGHINRNRNAQFLENIQCMKDTQVILVGSSSYPEDKDLAEELKRKGVIVISSYVDNIEELYQSVDCYLFPVYSDSACIEIPLSVLEAMATNLAVVTTKFGGLPNMIKEQDGFRYAATNEDFITKINLIKNISTPKTRDLVEGYSWKNVVQNLRSSTLA